MGEAGADVELVDVLQLVYAFILAAKHASAPDGADRMFSVVIAVIQRWTPVVAMG